MGVDQKGEITFDYSLKNCYLPVLSFLFALFFNLLFNAATAPISPSTTEGIRFVLNIQRFLTFILLCGFQALATYLCLPAEFFVTELGPELKHPYLAYLSILFGVVLCTVVSTIAQFYTTHQLFTNALSSSCRFGPASVITHGLSKGFLFNILPIVLLAVTLYFAESWLGTLGIALMAVGYMSFLPHYLYGQILYSYLENASFITCVTELDETAIQNLVECAKTQKDF
jgi:Na+/H+-translocating membrane pyrophosphatase